MKRKSMENSVCSIARTLDVIGDWWSLLIVRDALNGLTRFGEFQKHLGIAKNMLAQRLKQLSEQGILVSRPAADGSAWNEYALTDKGRDLYTVLVALSQWGGAHLPGCKEQCSMLVDTQRRQPLRKLLPQSVDGQALKAEDIVLLPPLTAGNQRPTSL